MDSIAKVRLQLRHQKLVQTIDEVRGKLELDHITEEALIGSSIVLKHVIDLFDKELQMNSNNLEVADFTNYMSNQLEAEELKVRLDSIIEVYNKKTLENQPNNTTKLPKLELNKFDGDILKWNEFWDKYEANIHCKPLKDVEKLSYLLGCLEGQALQTVGGLATTNSNYTIALDILRKRFGSSDRVIDAHHKALNEINVALDDPTECRLTLDSIERHLRVLQTLGENLESNYLRVTITQKFPERLMYQVNLLSMEDHTVPTLRSNLDKVITAMERSGKGLGTSATAKPPEDMISPVMTTEALQIKTEQQFYKPNFKRNYIHQRDGPPEKKQKMSCIFCEGKFHNSSSCRKFTNLEERKAKLKDRCLKCLSLKHKSNMCQKQISCYHCKGDHLKLLCPNLMSGENYEKQYPVPKTICKLSNSYTFLQTAVVVIQNPSNKKQLSSRLLLDSGSQRSYITSKAAKYLQLSTLKKDLLLIYTFGSDNPQEMSSPSTEIIIETKRNINRNIQVNIVPHITNRVPIAKIYNSKHNGVDIAADDDTVGEGVDVLVGNDFYCSFLRNKKIKINSNLYLIDTDLGWVMSGNAPQENNDVLSVTTYCQCHVPSCPYLTEPDLPLKNIDIKFLWSLESIGITDSPKATRQEQAVQHFNETVQYQDKRYEVKWPWIQYPPELPSNFGLALGRLRNLVKKLDDSSIIEYNSILMEQLKLGIIELIEPNCNQDDHPIHYLPHHMVKQVGKRGRLVYDASAKITGQKSLNECLYSGPSMLEDLTALLLKFRTKRIGIMADIEKAFLQVGLQQEDRDVTRFLWIKDFKKQLTEENIMYLRFCRVPFGIISSPFLLTATIKHHMALTNADLLETIANKCYVDNLVTGTNTVQEASHLYKQTRSTFEQLSMNMRDWVSNDKQFMDMVDPQHKAAHSVIFKVLGLSWNIQNDTLKLKLSEEHFINHINPIQTKRDVLRTLARIYDPCGFVCPLILPIKLHFQNICKQKIKWDTALPDNLMQPLGIILKNLKAVVDVELPRYIGADLPNINSTHELHCFTDASKDAYAAVVYLKTKGAHQTLVSFVMAKSRISQIEDNDDLKIPKLELLGFLIGSRLLKYVKTSLNLAIEKEYLWTDSLVVLGWINSNKLLPPFVSNRISEIKQNHKNTQMCYINTKLNPADIATRPEVELWDQRKRLWHNGPEFLTEEESHWPISHHYETHRNFLSSGEGLKGNSGLPEPCGSSEEAEPSGLPEPCGSSEEAEPHDWPDMEKINKNIPLEIDNDSLESEKTSELKLLQLQHFPDEMTGKKTHLVRNLDLFVDADGILRCGGRMANTTWSYNMKHPALLPNNCEFTNNIIIKTHESNYHVGASHTLSLIRAKYWIPQGRANVIKLIKTCQQCVKHGGGPYKLPATPSLPTERVNYSKPFSFTGVDYFGPLYIISPTGKEKRWVALFTCLAVRAVHLEVVNNLSAEECLLALRRFIATRGVPIQVCSDNATCFRLTSEVMTSTYCIDKEIKWKFIPQLAPWHGGFYERLISLVKHCLKRTLEKHLLNDSKLLTVMKEVEAVINSRPLTRVGTELEHVLRPADFLSLGNCLTTNPSPVEIPCTSSKIKSDLIESWKRGIKILEEYKKMFIGQYLICLRERSQHLPKEPRIRSDQTPKIGAIVQIKSDSSNRQNWKVGKIVNLIESADGAYRVAKVKVGDSILTRSVGHLYPLEEESDETPYHVHTKEQERISPSIPIAPDLDPQPLLQDQAKEIQQAPKVELKIKRDAAIRARAKILEWSRHLLVLLQ